MKGKQAETREGTKQPSLGHRESKPGLVRMLLSVLSCAAVCIGNHMDSSAIIPKLYENPCDCLPIIYFKSLNTTLRKQASIRHTSNRGAEQYRFC